MKLLQMAEEGTYTNELTGIFKRIGDLANEFPLIKQIIPFTRTPVNLMLNVVDRTPLGFIRKNIEMISLEEMVLNEWHKLEVN